MKEPAPRYWTKASIDALSDRLCLPNEPLMQDWPWEVADPAQLDTYLALFAELRGEDDLRFTLADVIIQAFDDLGEDRRGDARWTAFLEELARHLDVHAHQVWYWADFDSVLDDAFHVSPDMRALALRAR